MTAPDPADLTAVARKVANDLHDMRGILDETLWGLASAYTQGEWHAASYVAEDTFYALEGLATLKRQIVHCQLSLDTAAGLAHRGAAAPADEAATVAAAERDLETVKAAAAVKRGRRAKAQT